MNFYKINEEYLDYLRKYEKKISFTKEDKQNRKFVGVVLQINNVDYYAPLSSMIKLKHKIDFFIYHKSRIISCLKLNKGTSKNFNFSRCP